MKAFMIDKLTKNQNIYSAPRKESKTFVLLPNLLSAVMLLVPFPV